MRVRRTLLVIICVFVVIGLASLIFLPMIQTVVAGLRSATPMARTGPTNGGETPGQQQVPQTPAITSVVAQDSFQRPNQDYWGMSSDGQEWKGDANSSIAFTISNHTGQIGHANGLYNAVLGPPLTDAELICSGSLNTFTQANLGVVLRWRDKNNWYKAYIENNQIVLLKDVNGEMTRLATAPFQTSVNVMYTIRFRVVGTQLLARVWATGENEPATWQLQFQDGSLISGFGGVRVFLEGQAVATIATFTEIAIKG